MFRAILLGQWHSLSDPELERSLVTRLDFVLFCQFPDETHLPDHSTLNRFRNWLMKDQLLDELIAEINQQLARNQLKSRGSVLKSMLPEKIKRHQGKELYD